LIFLDQGFLDGLKELAEHLTNPTSAIDRFIEKMQNKQIRWGGLARGMRKSISRREYAGPDEELTLEKTQEWWAILSGSA
jgi:hypothetical protein